MRKVARADERFGQFVSVIRASQDVPGRSPGVDAIEEISDANS